MRKYDKSWLRRALLTSVASVIAASAFGLSASIALAQDADDDDVVEEILVTGSRIRRDEFTSAAPMQTFNIDAARQIGVTSISELLQRSTIANGQQIDGTLNTNSGNSNASEPPPLGGVGSANIALRGLGPERTLVLINSKRLGSAGVRGAPSQPDLNLLPLALVERIEVITKGASSIYGADAVAGVVNILLRNSFEGFEATANVEIPLDGGGEVYQFSMITGAETDRSSLVFAAEFTEQRRISVGQRRDCLESIAVDASGTLQPKFCSLTFFDNIVYEGNTAQPINPATGLPLVSDWFFYSDSIPTDVGVPNWISALSLPQPTAPQDCRRADLRCRGLGPIGFYGGQFDRIRGDLVQPNTKLSTVVLGTYQPDWFDANEELYFETYYFNRHSNVIGAIEQIFPTIQGQIRQIDENGNIIVDDTGAPILADNPLNPFAGDAIPIITIDDINQNRNVELSQFRFVGGMRGDLPGALGNNNWTYDLFFSYDRGVGFVSQPILSETNLILTTQNLVVDPDGNVSCDVPINDVFGFLTPQGCVPVNFFAPSLYRGDADGTGTFATAEERDFLVGQRANRTLVEQFVTGFSFTGDVFDIPTGGTVGIAVGAEFRRDSIASVADFVSANALNAGENPLAEGATVGSRDIYDVYGEVNIPILQGLKMVELLNLEGSVRYTDESNFGSEVTAGGAVSYSPNGWITLSGTYGTSFRAPNLRESFLAEQTLGVTSSADPCGVPPAANDGGFYNPANETRSATTLANCILSGADPTQLGLVANINIPVTISGNAQTLRAETSRTFTLTLQASPPISDWFEVDFAVSFYDIEVKDNIRSIDPNTILTRCFEGPANLTSPFCDRIERQQTGPETFKFVNFIDASFVNIGLETSQGVDVNVRFRTTLDDIMGAPLDIAASIAMNFLTERDEQIFAEDVIENLVGDFGLPKRRLQSTVSLIRDRWELIFDVRHISGSGADMDVRIANDCDTLDDALFRTGPNQLHPVCDAPGAWYEDVSVSYRLDTVFLTVGVNNIADKQPPLVSSAAGSSRANRLTSSGYDQLGRTVFFTATAAF